MLAWHCRCTWNFLHKLIQSTMAILVQRPRMCPLDRLLSYLNNVKRTDWEDCVLRSLTRVRTPPSTTFPLEKLNHSLRAQKNESSHKYGLKDTSLTSLAKRTTPPTPNPPPKQTVYSPQQVTEPPPTIQPNLCAQRTSIIEESG